LLGNEPSLKLGSFSFEHAREVMPTLLHITYCERTFDAAGLHVDTIIGEEAYDNIPEALVPTKHTHPVYVTKQFSHDSNTRWHVEDSCRTGANDSVPMTYQVVLSKVHNPPEIYLDQSLALSSHKIHQVLGAGTLVEVDYGFVQTVAQARGTTVSNSQYKDTIQHGEMHKRRLAIVVKARPSQVQVVPLSSVAPGALDKTVFLLDPATLSNLHFYGTSGKQTWGICNMVQTVSPSRLLPPSSYYTTKDGVRKHARLTTYRDRISTAELEAMRSALMHAIGVTNYDQLKTKAQNAQGALTAVAALQAQIDQLQQQLNALNATVARHEAVEELAVSWAKQMNVNFEQQVQGLMEINAQLTQ
jgi:uncharacterized protein YifN (PemK superfamily)